MAFGALEKSSWTGKVFNDLPDDNELELVPKVEVSRIRAHHVKAFSPQGFDLILFVIQSHQIRRPFAKNAVKPILCLARGEVMVDTTNVQNPLAFGKASNEGGTAQQHKSQVFIGAAQAAILIFS